MKHCSATTAANIPCQAYHMIGSELCFTHNPATTAAHCRAAQRGGSVSKADRVERQRLSVARTANKLPETAQNSSYATGEAHE